MGTEPPCPPPLEELGSIPSPPAHSRASQKPSSFAEGFQSWMWRGLTFLLPFLFFGQVRLQQSLQDARASGGSRMCHILAVLGGLDMAQAPQAATAM